MPAPTEHKSVQARILKYAEEIGWSFVPRSEAEKRRGFAPSGISPREKAKNASWFFADTLYEKAKEFNPKFKDSKDELLRKLNLPLPTIQGNRDFLQFLQGEKTFFSAEENREFNLVLINFEQPDKNIYEVTEEYYLYNGQYANREDVVFLINGIPVLVIECKNATKDEAIAIGIDQIRRYHRETPEFFVPQQIFTVTESIGFSYGVTWNTIKRNIFNWKIVKGPGAEPVEVPGMLEAKIKSFFDIRNILAYLKNYIIFAEVNEELNKYILRQHQKAAVEKVVERAHDPKKFRGLVWHTQGSGKTYTMIKAAELLFKAPESEKPTILLMIDRNELEDQMLKNLSSVGVNNVVQAEHIKDLQKLLQSDYRGIIVSMIHKFRDMPADVNERKNIHVLIDEAHRTTGGDLGNYLMAAIPNATY